MSYFLSYDSEGNKAEKTSINGQTKTITTGTDEDGKAFVSNDGVTAKTVTDNFGRTTEIKTSRGEGNSVFFTDYEYTSGKYENSTTNLVSKLTQKYGADDIVRYEYTYDKNGNITEIKQNGKVSNKYTYDSLNQLIKEYDYVNRFFIIYSYDGAGNIQAKNEQYLDPTYDYPVGKPQGNVYYYNDTEWKDKLTKINNDDITYDESGNPLSYRDGMSFTWQNGRQLASLQTEDNSVTYKYDSNGMRTQKTDNNGTTSYYYDSNKNLIGLTKGNDTLLFYYDSDANVTSFKYNGTMYYYIKNLQGDIVKIIDQAGTEVAGYVYDAWGTIHSQTGDPNIRRLNPFRYRGYVYDEETSLYYLQSRYYDPFSGRFLNADDTAFIGATGTVLSCNLFTYCENNPINKYDKNGNIAANVIGAVIGGIVGAIGGYFLTNWLADKLSLKGWKKNVFVWGLSAVIGAAAAVIGYFIGPYVAKITVKLGQYVASLIRKGKITFKKLSSSAKSSIKSLLKQTCCFVAGTQISTTSGSENIEDISIGDSVYAFNPETGEIGVKKVLNVFMKQTSILYHVNINSEEIVTTNEHPFWVIGKGWVAAEDLTSGDILYLQDYKYVTINYVFQEVLSKPTTVYNFEVEDWHTYFVGSNKILVHNKCSLTKVKDSYLKKQKLDAHAIKKEVLGKKAKISQYNLFYDKNTKAIFVLKNGAKESEKILTGYFLK